jgi:hypothetical protein
MEILSPASSPGVFFMRRKYSCRWRDARSAGCQYAAVKFDRILVHLMLEAKAFPALMKVADHFTLKATA